MLTTFAEGSKTLTPEATDGFIRVRVEDDRDRIAPNRSVGHSERRPGNFGSRVPLRFISAACYSASMNAKVKIEVDARTAELLEARAAARGLSVADLLADLAATDNPLPPRLEAMRENGEGPWSPEMLAEDARHLAEFNRTRMGVPWDEVKAWMQSWGTSNELPAPKPRKL
jgi:hypothetical protein